MSDTIERNITDIRMDYRLMLHSRITEARQKGDKSAEKAAFSDLEKDDVQISDAGKSAQPASLSIPNRRGGYFLRQSTLEGNRCRLHKLG